MLKVFAFGFRRERSFSADGILKHPVTEEIDVVSLEHEVFLDACSKLR